MQNLVGRAVIGLGVIVAAVAAVGYAFVFVGIASPPSGALGRVPVPADGEVVAAVLDDGTPVFVVARDASVFVLDARAPRDAGEIAALVGWCEEADAFHDTLGGGSFGFDGAAIESGSRTGLVRLEARLSADRAFLDVGPGSEPSGVSADPRAVSGCPAGSAWVTHEPGPGEAFDPSVAVDQEPPGWIWLEGHLEVAGGVVKLCDAPGACDTWAPVGGIDPARAPVAAGRFIGEVHDGVIEGLTIVPSSGESS